MRTLISALVLLILDFIWIGLFMGPRYKKMIANVQKSPMTIRKKHALLAYTCMIVGLSIFVIPNVRKHSLSDSILYGGSCGLVLYGVYDFTAAAVLENWDESLAIIDILWGAFVYTISAFVGSFSG